MGTTVRIFHFDDELELVDWIPEMLRQRYATEHPGWLDGEPEVESDDKSYRFSFKLRPEPGRELDVAYLSFRTTGVAEFNERFQAQPEDVLILDLYHDMVDGTLEEVGVDYYHAAKARLRAERIYVLTGYPDRARARLHNALLPGHLFSKPPDPAAVISELSGQLRSVVDRA